MAQEQKLSNLRIKVRLLIIFAFICFGFFGLSIFYNYNFTFGLDEWIFGVENTDMLVWFSGAFFSIFATYLVRCENCGMWYGFQEEERENIYDIADECPKCWIKRR